MKLTGLFTLLYLLHFAAYSQRSPAPDVVKIDEVATSKSYGLKKKTNIKVGSINNEYQYIAQLTGPNGEATAAHRLGSCCNVKAPNDWNSNIQMKLKKWTRRLLKFLTF